MRTRDEGDMDRIRLKYGENIMKSVVKASVGSGMFVNAEYNKGAPYFTTFRPMFHDTDRLLDEELKKYYKYNNIIEEIEYQIEQLNQENVDVFDIKIELKIAKSKLMTGAFNMVDIYLESIKPMLESVWKKIGKTPKKRVVQLVSEDEIKKSIEIARQKREEYLKKQAEEMKKQNKHTDKKEEFLAIKKEIGREKEDAEPEKNKNERAEINKNPVNLTSGNPIAMKETRVSDKSSSFAYDKKEEIIPNEKPREEKQAYAKKNKKFVKAEYAQAAKKEKSNIDKMIDDYNEIMDKIKKKEKKGENVYLIKTNINNILEEIEFLKNKNLKEEEEKMKAKLKKIKHLL